MDEKKESTSKEKKKEKIDEKKQVLTEQKEKIEERNDSFVCHEDNNFYFVISPSDFIDEYVQKSYFIWGSSRSVYANVGTLIVPLKIRPELGSTPFDFTTDFTVGATIGAKVRISKYKPNYLSLIAVGGVTTVNIDSTSTRGYVSELTKQSAITPGLGLVMDIDGFQVGFITGLDFIGGQTGRSWIYNKKAWFSFGIGYEFIKPKEKK